MPLQSPLVDRAEAPRSSAANSRAPARARNESPANLANWHPQKLSKLLPIGPPPAALRPTSPSHSSVPPARDCPLGECATATPPPAAPPPPSVAPLHRTAKSLRAQNMR